MVKLARHALYLNAAVSRLGIIPRGKDGAAVIDKDLHRGVIHKDVEAINLLESCFSNAAAVAGFLKEESQLLPVPKQSAVLSNEDGEGGLGMTIGEDGLKNLGVVDASLVTMKTNGGFFLAQGLQFF